MLHGVTREILRKCEGVEGYSRIEILRSHPAGAMTTRTVGRRAPATASALIR